MQLIDEAHAIIYSHDVEADRKFLTGVLGLRSVDAGGGWLIFGLPPSEVASIPTRQGPDPCGVRHYRGWVHRRLASDLLLRQHRSIESAKLAPFA